MEEVISEYRRLLDLLEQEQQQAALGLQGELLEIYRDILRKEREKVENSLRILKQNIL